MRAVVSRVAWARVVADGELTGEIGPGLLILVGITHGDTEADAAWLAAKVAALRVFDDDQGKMNRSLADTGGGALVVSQFTLYGDARKGRRPPMWPRPRPSRPPPGRGRRQGHRRAGDPRRHRPLRRRHAGRVGRRRPRDHPPRHRRPVLTARSAVLQRQPGPNPTSTTPLTPSSARRTHDRESTARARSTTTLYSPSQPKVITQNTSPSPTIPPAPCAGEANCGSRLRKNAAIFGLARLLTIPCRNARPGRIRRLAPGPDRPGPAGAPTHPVPRAPRPTRPWAGSPGGERSRPGKRMPEAVHRDWRPRATR